MLSHESGLLIPLASVSDYMDVRAIFKRTRNTSVFEGEKRGSQCPQTCSKEDVAPCSLRQPEFNQTRHKAGCLILEGSEEEVGLSKSINYVMIMIS